MCAEKATKGHLGSPMPSEALQPHKATIPCPQSSANSQPAPAAPSATQPKRKKRTKAQIAADKQAAVEEKMRVMELENNLKEKLEQKVALTQTRDKLLTAHRNAQLIGRRLPATTSSAIERPIEDDDVFSSSAAAPKNSAAAQHATQIELSDGEDFELELREVEKGGDTGSESELDVVTNADRVSSTDVLSSHLLRVDCPAAAMHYYGVIGEFMLISSRFWTGNSTHETAASRRRAATRSG